MLTWRLTVSGEGLRGWRRGRGGQRSPLEGVGGETAVLCFQCAEGGHFWGLREGPEEGLGVLEGRLMACFCCSGEEV